MQSVAAGRHVLEVFSFVEEEVTSSSIYSCDYVLRYPIEQHNESLENGCMGIDHLQGGVRR